MTPTSGPLPPPATDQAVDVDQLWDLYLWIGYGVTALVTVLVAIIIIRFRRRSDDLPVQKHYNIPAEVTYTVIPFLLVIGLFAASFSTTRALDRRLDEPDLVVDVTAFQWQWEFGYPATGVTVSGADATVPVLVLPADRSIRFDMRSPDVIHSFWITSFRYKRDIIPGRPATFSVRMGDDVTGWYPLSGVCAEFCGLDHATMRFSVLILGPTEFDAWLAAQPTDRKVVLEPAAAEALLAEVAATGADDDTGVAA